MDFHKATIDLKPYRTEWMVYDKELKPPISAASLLKDASRNNVNKDAVKQLDKSINSSNYSVNQPKEDDGSGPIQNPITSNKANWCLVGEYQGNRGCIEVDDESKCMSGQTFPTQHMCLNPARNISTHTHK